MSCSMLKNGALWRTLHHGPTVTLISDLTPLDFFNLLFGDDTCKMITKETNRYARQNPPGDECTWQDTLKEEIQQFLGVIIAMGIHELTLPHVLQISGLQIHCLVYLGLSVECPQRDAKCYCVNSTVVAREQSGFDKLHKLRPLIDTIHENSLKLNKPGRDLSIDEAMVGYEGRSSLKQYMPNKPTKRGYKIWCIM